MEVPRPTTLETDPLDQELKGGRCTCGALYLLDATGKEGGRRMMDGLYLIADQDMDRALALQSGEDYRVESVCYNYRMHTAESRTRKKGYAQPKLWFFILKSAAE